ncbi:MAG: cysteine desulfurase / selenocysteine lyase [Frankiales bacterium]|jgi:cysteine desulfurase/selenocysteine lyase|nr:cysteine desulfurase / selenocysteine lyase [Frankiales bacterium]
MTLDVERIRKDFPVLERRVHDDQPLVYLDSAATSQKPRAVLDAMAEYYELHNANVHRGIHTLAEEATALYEGARDTVAGFVNATDRSEVVFTKNSTEGLNLLARTIGDSPSGGESANEYGVGPGDEICITEMEHHSNIVPWQLLAQRTGATLKWIGLTDDGRLDVTNLDQVINDRTKVVAFVHQSNILGTLNPVEPIVRRAREVGALTILDASQSVPHRPVDLQSLDVDAAVFTGHKMLGPTGIGVLWARRAVLDALPPFLGGGEMISVVQMDGSTFAEPPHKFEAGTPMIAEAVGLAAAVDYLQALGMTEVAEHEAALTSYALDALHTVDGLRVIGPDTTEQRGGAISFVLGDLHPHDVGQVLDERGIAVRVGQHCAAPVCRRMGVPATTRASFAPYTSFAEIDALVDGLEYVRRFFG